MDARKLAIKYNENPTTWTPVEKYLMKKSDPSYYKDPVVIAGYCKCEEPVRYVEEVLNRYEEYKMHIQ
jgi:membrane-bound lytic murein transglycosylase F